jgi:phosphatidylglycerophosphate synthase
MFDARIRPYIDPYLDRYATWLHKWGLRADHLTWIGLAFGALAAFFLLYKAYIAGLLFIGLNRLADGLDGPLARMDKAGASDAGGYLDIVFDFIVYAGLPFCLAAGLDTKTAWAATSFLLLGITFSGTAFLAYAVLAAKHGHETEAQGKKGFFYASGLMEGAETIVFLCLMCIVPQFYPVLASIFGGLCLITGAGRIGRALMDYT